MRQKSATSSSSARALGSMPSPCSSASLSGRELPQARSAASCAAGRRPPPSRVSSLCTSQGGLGGRARDEFDESGFDLGPRREGLGRNAEAGCGAWCATGPAPRAAHSPCRPAWRRCGRATSRWNISTSRSNQGGQGSVLSQPMRSGVRDAVGQIGDDAGRRVEARACYSRRPAHRRRSRRAGPDSARRCRARAGRHRSSFSMATTRAAPSSEQRTGEAAGTGTDLDDGRCFERTGGAGDAARQIEIEQEVLAEALARGQAEARITSRSGGKPSGVLTRASSAGAAHGVGEAQRLDQAARAGACPCRQGRRRCRGRARCA